MKTVCLVWFLFLWFQTASAQKQGMKPNVIVILTDDQGYADVGFHGCKDIPTPGIDRIARNGVVFSSGYVSYAVCGPSRAGLLTGRYQDRFGFSRNPLLAPNDPSMGLPLSEQTLADYLRQAGYQTGIIGKWHLGAHEDLRPNKRGFNEFFGFLSGGHQYFPENLLLNDVFDSKTQFDGYRTKLLRNEVRIEEKEYLTDAFSREALDFVRRHRSNPFFLYLAYNAPHTPLQATRKYLDRFTHIPDERRRTYAAMVSAVDDGVGALLDLITELGLEENTLIFFLSDNGGPEGTNASDNGALRGKKGDFFEGGIRVPFAMQWKGIVSPGTVYEHPVISLDIFATMSSLVGEMPANPLDGVDLIPFLKGERSDPPHHQLFWRNFDAQRFAVRTAGDKMIQQPDGTLLFDMRSDQSEKADTSEEDPARVKDLHQKILRWERLLKEPGFPGLAQDKEYSKAHPERFKRY